MLDNGWSKIFIDLHELHLTKAFFQLELEIHTSQDVYLELYPEKQELLHTFSQNGQLYIHNLSGDDRIQLTKQNYSGSLSAVDQTVLFLAEKHDALVLTSDNVMRKTAKKKAINYHGILWIFDQLVEHQVLPEKEAATSLKRLLEINVMYAYNRKLKKEFEKRLGVWGKIH